MNTLTAALIAMLLILAYWIAARWLRAWRIERRHRTSERARRWLRVDRAPMPDSRSSIDQFRRIVR